MRTPLTLTWTAVKAAARKAYREGRLSAQNVDTMRIPTCEYRDKNGFPCAIGAAIPNAFCEENLAGLNNQSSVTMLIDDGLINVRSRAGLGKIKSLQSFHDWWFVHATRSNLRDVKIFERRFCDLLGIKMKERDQ